MRKKYETVVTDERWEIIKPLFVNMRKRKREKRELVNVILYLVKTGCQWRNLPHDFPPVFTVHSFYRRVRLSGLWDRILEHLVKLARQRAGLSEMPTQASIDSQSVKSHQSGESKTDGRMSKRGSLYLRRAVWLAVFKDHVISLFYQKKCAERKNYLTVIGHVCHKILTIIFAILCDNKPYVPASTY